MKNKKIILIISLVIIFCIIFIGIIYFFGPVRYPIKTEREAIRYGEPFLRDKYPEAFDSQTEIHAIYTDEVWIVYTSTKEKDPNKMLLGGDVGIKFTEQGEILSIYING